MRTRLEVEFLAYDNSQPTNDPANAIKVKKRVEESSVSDITRYFPMTVANSVVDQAVILPDPNTDYIILLTDQTISVKLNGSAAPLTLNPSTPGVVTPVLMIRGDVTALTVSNASGNPANLDLSAVKI
jgi:hypothetical protein